MVEQAERFSLLAPNMIVKIPATEAGIEAIEEATWRGISINATVSFALSQALAVAEAVERGLKRREAEKKDISTTGPGSLPLPRLRSIAWSQCMGVPASSAITLSR